MENKTIKNNTSTKNHQIQNQQKPTKIKQISLINNKKSNNYSIRPSKAV